MFSDIISVIVYGFLGVVIFLLALTLMEAITKYSINKKITEDGNIALAIVLASIIISLGIIISSAIH